MRRAGVIAVLCWALAAAQALALGTDDVVVLAVTQGKAVLRIAGQRRVLEAGQTSPEGVTLLEADTAGVALEIAGQREYLPYRPVLESTGTDADVGSGDSSAPVVLWSGPDGFFHADGAINGYPVRFLVDTGASSIALSSELARRIGIDLSAGRVGYADTAGGVTQVVRVRLRSVKLGTITLRDLDAGVIMGSHPQHPLLGMSFLGELEMRRSGNRMELSKRY